MKKRFTEEQVIGFLREADAGMPVKDLCRRHGFSEASYYLWRGKFGGPGCLGRQAPEDPGSGEHQAQEAAGRGHARTGGDPRGDAKKVVTAPARREVVRTMTTRGLSERHALRVVRMSASSLRYRPAPDRNIALRERIRRWPTATDVTGPA